MRTNSTTTAGSAFGRSVALGLALVLVAMSWQLLRPASSAGAQEPATIYVEVQIEPDGYDTSVQFLADFGSFALGDGESYQVQVSANEEYTITAVVPSGWTYGAANCDDLSRTYTVGTSIITNLAEGGLVNCTVTLLAPESPCPPGFFSVTGAAPCTPAPVGSFVDQHGATEAQPCPVGFTTAGVGSASGSDCIADGAISVEVSTGPADADTAPGPEILAGETVGWFYQVTNTGGFTLSDLSVTDDQGVTVGCPVSVLVSGATTVCTGTATAVEGAYANVGTATGSYVNGHGATVVVSGTDPSHHFGAVPSASISKAFATDEVIAGGAGSSFSLVVTNDGNVNLVNLLVFDDVDERLSITGVAATAGVDSDTDLDPQTVEWLIPSLPVGGSVTVTATFAVASDVQAIAALSNTGSVTGSYSDDVDNSTGIASSASDTVAIALLDTDGDGVPDVADLCEGTDVDPAPQRLKKNRNWPDPTETFGCSPTQIIDAAGLGAGHGKFGISNSALAAWIASVS